MKDLLGIMLMFVLALSPAYAVFGLAKIFLSITKAVAKLVGFIFMLYLLYIITCSSIHKHHDSYQQQIPEQAWYGD